VGRGNRNVDQQALVFPMGTPPCTACMYGDGALGNVIDRPPIESGELP